MAAKKYLKQVSGNLVEQAATVTSSGASNDGDLVALDATGRLDSSIMPAGFGAETKSIVASEALSAGDFVNVYSNAGTPNVRKADASSTAKRAHGYVLAAVSNGANATVYYGNLNNQVSGQTVGAELFLSASTPGAATATAPSGAGQLVQRLGVATSATEILVEIQPPIQLA